MATLGAWTKASSIGTTQRIIQLTYDNTYTKIGIAFTSANAIIATARAALGESNYSKTTNTAISDYNWHYIAATFDLPNDSIRIYVDGIEKAATGTPAFTSEVFGEGAGNCAIGSNGTGGEKLTGLVDEVQISDTIRDIPTLWNSGTYNKPLEVDANTVALYHLNDAGQTIEDASSNNNDGTKGATGDPGDDDPTTVDSTVNVTRSYPGASFVAPMNGSQTGMEGEAATYTRNSVGTYIDDAGKIQEVTANNPRYEKRSGTLQNGLVGHWKMNEASWSSVAGEVIDSSGTGYNGRSYSSANTTTGKLDRAGEMVGDTSRVDIGDVPYLNNVPAFTYSAWLKK